MALEAKRAGKSSFDVEKKKKRIQAEMREAWSEQKERKALKDVRREKREKRKDAEWAAKGNQEEIGPVEAFRREKSQGKKRTAEDDAADEEERGADAQEYKSLKKEVKEERRAKKGRKDVGAVGAGMFDGLD